MLSIVANSVEKTFLMILQKCGYVSDLKYFSPPLKATRVGDFFVPVGGGGVVSFTILDHQHE